MFCILFGATVVNAQIFIGGGFGGRMGGGYMMQRPRNRTPKENEHKFKPIVTVSLGYGFPNLDKNALPDYYNYFKGTASQSGPINGSIDVQFSKSASIGLMVTHGTASIPYYNYNNPSTLAMSGSLDNWSYMLNFVRYMPAGKVVTPYIRTAIGINAWSQNFVDATGNKINQPLIQSDLAYQIGIGARFNITKNAGLFIEGGYGKYILNGGLSFKF